LVHHPILLFGSLKNGFNMHNKIVDITSKIFIPLALVGLIALFVHFNIKDERNKEGLYRVDFGNQKVWTKQITMINNGGIEFVDLNSKRKYAVYGSYAVINPKNK
jgi:hypothetical protein